MCWVPKSFWARTWETRAVQFLGLSQNQARFSGTHFPSVLTLRAQIFRVRQEPDLGMGTSYQQEETGERVWSRWMGVFSKARKSLGAIACALFWIERRLAAGKQAAWHRTEQPSGLDPEIPRVVEVKRTWWPIRQGVSRLGEYPDPREKQLSQLCRVSPTLRFSLPGSEIQFFNTLANYVAD